MRYFGVASFAFLLVQSTLHAASARISLRDGSSVTPIQKVLQMMAEALKKGKKEKNEEEVEFTKFKVFCEEVLDDKTKAIAEATKKIEQLQADIEKAESDVQVLSDEIKEHEADVTQWEADLEEAKKIRASEKADYDATHADYSESIDAVGRAIVALKKKDKDIPQSLMQIQGSKLIPEDTKATIQSFVALAHRQPQANAYESQSGGIIEMLEGLLKKFEDELFALEKAEMNNKANFDQLAGELTHNLKDGNADIKSKTAAKAGRKEDAADAKGALDTTLTSKMEDDKMLSDTKSECYAKSDEYEKNQVMRAGEIEAITKAMEILQSPAVSGKFLQVTSTTPSADSAPSLIQVRELEHSSVDTRSRVAQFLQRQAQKVDSRLLALAASRIQADPFKKVKKMIKDMIVKLMEEANAEAEAKGFCDAELATNKMTRDVKTSKVEELTSGIEEHTAKKEKLTEDIAELSGAIAEIKKQQDEATSLRQEEKAKNMAIIKDAQAGQKAVEMAIKVLKDFYDKASEASFMQGSEDMSQAMKERASLMQTGTDASQASKEPYQPGADGGIMGMLEVILSDFAQEEAEATSAEDAAADEYDKFMADTNEDAAVKQAEVDHKTTSKQRCEEALTELNKDLEVVQAELDAALAYYEKLKPDCVDAGESYEDRVARRKAEIVSLQEALKILSGEELA